MIVILLSYKVAPEMVTTHRPAHLEWLREACDAGRLLVSGRKAPPTGGMIIVRGTKAEAEQWCRTDPFAIHDLADYSFIEIEPSMTAPGLEALAE